MITIGVTRVVFDDVLLLKPVMHKDNRGTFSETYNEKLFESIGISDRFVQDNHVHTEKAGTIRGMHFQLPPRGQAKLVRVVRGRVLDVVTDVRKGSLTFGKWAAIELSEHCGNQLFAPAGYAHGYCTLENQTEVVYKVSDFYSPEHEAGFLWNDPQVGIAWPVEVSQAVLSDKDRNLPPLSRCLGLA